eukprot:GDKJ01003137.1.p1 GENE.GDKJ01003137.1~~GDKJ01003137.1.p1  ORF type:complete len:159 (+),score=28.04 GDKJ01003137.1:37-513(+)
MRVLVVAVIALISCVESQSTEDLNMVPVVDDSAPSADDASHLAHVLLMHEDQTDLSSNLESERDLRHHHGGQLPLPLAMPPPMPPPMPYAVPAPMPMVYQIPMYQAPPPIYQEPIYQQQNIFQQPMYQQPMYQPIMYQQANFRASMPLTYAAPSNKKL